MSESVQLTSETKCSNPFCTDGQTEQGSCLRCGGTGRETVARTSKPLVALAMSARSMLRQAKCPECHYNGTQGGAGKCHWCLERAALMDALLSQPTPDETRAVQVPPLDGGMRKILGRPNFACAQLAAWLREKGHEINRRAEDEQAAVLHWSLNLYLQHGEKWTQAADDYLKPTPLKALPPQCSCDPNPSIGGSPPCPVHDGENEEEV